MHPTNDHLSIKHIRLTSWVTNGWYHVQPNSEIVTDALTQNSTFYYYGKTNDNYEWLGTDEQGFKAYIANEKFTSLNTSDSLQGHKDIEIKTFGKFTGKILHFSGI